MDSLYLAIFKYLAEHFSVLEVVLTLALVYLAALLKKYRKTTSIGSTPDAQEEERVICSPERMTDCRLKIFEATRKRVKAVCLLREELLKAQLRYASNKLDFMVQKLTDDFILLLASRKESADYKLELPFLLYKANLLEFKHDVFYPRIEAIVVENHILDKNANQWKEHKKQALEGFAAEFGHFVDTQFLGEDIPRETFEKFQVEKWPWISTKLLEILDNARNLAVEYDIKVKQVKKKYGTQIFGSTNVATQASPPPSSVS